MPLETTDKELKKGGFLMESCYDRAKEEEEEEETGG